jgi:hypothetical protein
MPRRKLERLEVARTAILAGMRGLRLVFVVGSIVIALAAACGDSGDSIFGGGDGTPDSGFDPGPGPIFPPSEGGTDPDAQAQPIEITPADPVVTFISGQPAPTVQFQAKLVATGQIVPAIFAIDRGELGTTPPSTGLFTASGTVGGKGKITATWSGTSASTSITVNLKVVENGGSPIADAGADGGAGGNGGVGGNGPGGAVDATTIGVLKGVPVADPGLSTLYPYDATVWPRGILAPLLMWAPGAQVDYDAMLIKIKENAFEYEGTFLKNATPFQNHPITQQAWKQMLSSNQGEEVTVTLVFSKGAVAYGPLTLKWKVASAPLKGIVYYNSYGTKLAMNYTGAKPNNGPFGGATLAIRGNSTDPTLVAGGTGDSSYCRVCHSVAANGSVLITQRREAGDKRFSTYDLKGPTETTMSPEGATANFAWSAIYPDGTMFLNDSSGAPGSSNAVNQLFNVVSGAGPQTPAAQTTTGWPAGLRAAFPAVSPDGKQVAFGMYAGMVGADKRTVAFMPFDKTTKAFGALKELYRPANAAHSAMYPAFLPTNDAIVFGVETRWNNRGYGETRSDGDSGGSADIGAHGELWWVNVSAAGTPVAARLDKLNGTGHAPNGPASSGHEAGADLTLNYEPTVNPVPSGGYAWVVFTSRRLYGNVATINPFHSDPRNFDITQTPTTKKLWVAAVDLNAAPGTDPSHPAFYLPAQELLAGNSRGFWVVDPCKSDGNSCETGDECCGGFCRPNATGALVCSNVVPQCAQEFEKCTVSADCCNSPAIQCINGRCAVPLPK